MMLLNGVASERNESTRFLNARANLLLAETRDGGADIGDWIFMYVPPDDREPDEPPVSPMQLRAKPGSGNGQLSVWAHCEDVARGHYRLQSREECSTCRARNRDAACNKRHAATVPRSAVRSSGFALTPTAVVRPGGRVRPTRGTAAALPTSAPCDFIVSPAILQQAEARVADDAFWIPADHLV